MQKTYSRTITGSSYNIVIRTIVTTAHTNNLWLNVAYIINFVFYHFLDKMLKVMDAKPPSRSKRWVVEQTDSLCQTCGVAFPVEVISSVSIIPSCVRTVENASRVASFFVRTKTMSHKFKRKAKARFRSYRFRDESSANYVVGQL